MQEKVLKSAIWYNGKSWVAHDHSSALRMIDRRYDNCPKGWVAGFVTNRGRFVDRKDAYGIAKSAGQIEDLYSSCPILCSEDLKY